jgi:hypothetical protein
MRRDLAVPRTTGRPGTPAAHPRGSSRPQGNAPHVTPSPDRCRRSRADASQRGTGTEVTATPVVQHRPAGAPHDDGGPVEPAPRGETHRRCEDPGR